MANPSGSLKVMGNSMDVRRCDDPMEFLRLFHEPGSVFEIRALNCPTKRGGTFRRTAVAYVNQFDKVLPIGRQLQQLEPLGIYTTLNPVLPCLLGRAANQLVLPCEKTTADSEVVRRRWLLVDIDPRRPSGIPSSDVEMNAALDVAARIQTDLTSAGWPEMLRAMTGNGACLLARIDLPNDDASMALVRDVLRALSAMFSTPEVVIDTNVFNASRMVKVLGTMARKGSNVIGLPGVEDRPHRKTWFVRPSGELRPVPIELLRDMASRAVAEKTVATAAADATTSAFRSSGAGRVDAVERCRRYIARMPDAISGQGGHRATFAAACECFRFGLDDAQARDVMGWFNLSKTGGEPWGESELDHKLADARQRVEAAGEFGCRLKESKAGPSTDINATETVVIDGVGGVALKTWLRTSRKPQREVQIAVGAIAHADHIDVRSATSRKKLLRNFAEKAGLKLDQLLGPIDTKLVELARALDKDHPEAATASQGTTEKKTQAVQLIELAHECEIWRTPDRTGYATITVGGHQENWPLDSREFKFYLQRRFYEETEGTPSTESLASALALLQANAVHDGETHDVYIRVAELEGAVYLDLGGDNWESVEITAEGWRVIDNPPVRFRRARGMLPLPLPERGGSVDELRRVVNISDESWPLVAAWLVGCFQPTTSFPVLTLNAPQGAGKSTAGKMFRGLVDPNKSDLRCEPRDARDLAVAANKSFILAYDNLSYIFPWLSDGLCRLSTGGGFATRELYSNDEEIIFDAMRPIILTSIEEVATASDLIDRCLIVSLSSISESNRRDEKTLWEEYEKIRPRVIGALLDAVASAIKYLPSVRLERLPRMASFAKWVTAAEPALGWPPNAFMEAYTSNRRLANDVALEANPITKPLLELLAEFPDGWIGSASELLDALNRRAGYTWTAGEIGGSGTWPKKPTRKWPGNGRALSSQLRRLAPNLFAAGWQVEFDKSGNTGRRIVFTPTENAPDSASLASPASRGEHWTSLGDANTVESDTRDNFASSLASQKNTEKNSVGDARDAGTQIPATSLETRNGTAHTVAHANGDAAAWGENELEDWDA